MLILCVMAGCKPKAEINPHDLNRSDVTIAIEVDTPGEDAVKELYPKAKIKYVNGFMDGILEVQTRKSAAYCGDRGSAISLKNNGVTDVKRLDKDLGHVGDVAIMISPKTRIPHAEELINGFIDKITADGTLDALRKRWIKDGNYTMPDIPQPRHPKRVIRVATTGLMEPFTFMQGGELTGSEIELVRRFAVYANAKIILSQYDWSGLFTVITTDKVDYAISNCYVRKERKEVMKMSKPYYQVVPAFYVLSDKKSEVSLLEQIKTGIDRNFIRENRWRNILGGLWVTIKLFVCSILLGTVLGFIVCLGKRSRRKPLARTLNAITLFLNGVPVLILLMILYYVVFTNSSGASVAIIAFGINFAASVSDIMKASIDGIDRGSVGSRRDAGFQSQADISEDNHPAGVEDIYPGVCRQCGGNSAPDQCGRLHFDYRHDVCSPTYPHAHL